MLFLERAEMTADLIERHCRQRDVLRAVDEKERWILDIL